MVGAQGGFWWARPARSLFSPPLGVHRCHIVSLHESAGSVSQTKIYSVFGVKHSPPTESRGKLMAWVLSMPACHLQAPPPSRTWDQKARTQQLSGFGFSEPGGGGATSPPLPLLPFPFPIPSPCPPSVIGGEANPAKSNSGQFHPPRFRSKDSHRASIESVHFLTGCNRETNLSAEQYTGWNYFDSKT